MSKLPQKYENPIDNLIVKTFFYDDFIHKLGITPNMITLFRISLFLYVYYNYNNKTILITYIFNYYLDCLDGYISRKYNQNTVLGDYLDHVSDLITSILLFYILFPTLNKLDILIIITFIILQNIHLGCQQKYHNKNTKNKETLDIFRNLCFCDINISKYFGCGTFTLILSLYYYYKLIYQK